MQGSKKKKNLYMSTLVKSSLCLPTYASLSEQSVVWNITASYGMCRLQATRAHPWAPRNLLVLDFVPRSYITDHNEQPEWVCSSALSSGVYAGVLRLTDLHLSDWRINCESRMKQKQVNLHSDGTATLEPPLFVTFCRCLMVCKSLFLWLE